MCVCVRILLLFRETNQLTAGSRSPLLAGGTRWLSARQGLPATSGDGHSSEIRFSSWSPLAVLVGCLAGAGRAGKDTEGGV